MALKQADEPKFFDKLRSSIRSALRGWHGRGSRAWAIPGGLIPLESRGEEPRFTSRDEISILNASSRPAKVEITIYYSTRDPVGPYRLEVGAQRTRRIRFNDLIDPEAIPLDTTFAAMLECNTPVIVHFSRLDTGGGGSGMSGTMAHPVA